MYFWLKFFHIAAMAVWFTALFLLPRLFIASLRASGAEAVEDEDAHARLNAIGKTLYFGLMTPAAVLTVALGIVLISYGFDGPWLPAKLAVVALAVLLHLYFGQLLVDLSRGHNRHGSAFYRLLNWLPLPLLIAIAALAAAKPGALPPLGGV
jgi:putative membrane protein